MNSVLTIKYTACIYPDVISFAYSRSSSWPLSGHDQCSSVSSGSYALGTKTPALTRAELCMTKRGSRCDVANVN